MTRQIKILYLIILGLSFTVVTLFIHNIDNINENTVLKEQIKSAQKEIKTEKEYRNKINNKLDSLDTKISKTKQVINNITVERDKKVEEVNNYNNKQLKQYFDERYGK